MVNTPIPNTFLGSTVETTEALKDTGRCHIVACEMPNVLLSTVKSAAYIALRLPFLPVE